MANSSRKEGKNTKGNLLRKMVCIRASKLQIFDRTINPEYKVEIATAFRVAVKSWVVLAISHPPKITSTLQSSICPLQGTFTARISIFCAYCVCRLIVCHFSQWALEGGGWFTHFHFCAKIAFTHVYT